MNYLAYLTLSVLFVFPWMTIADATVQYLTKSPNITRKQRWALISNALLLCLVCNTLAALRPLFFQ